MIQSHQMVLQIPYFVSLCFFLCINLVIIVKQSPKIIPEKIVMLVEK